MRHELQTQYSSGSPGGTAAVLPGFRPGAERSLGLHLGSSSPRAWSPRQAEDAAIFIPGQPSIGHRFGARWELPGAPSASHEGPGSAFHPGPLAPPVPLESPRLPDRAPFLPALRALRPQPASHLCKRLRAVGSDALLRVQSAAATQQV